MIVRALPVGSIQANCYILMDEISKEGYIVDPGGEAENIIAFVEELGCEIIGVLLTHGHGDHIAVIDEIKAKYNVPVYIHRNEVTIEDGVTYIKQPDMFNYVGDRDITNYIKDKIKNELGVICVKSNIEFTYVSDGETIPFGNNEIKCIHTPGHTLGGLCFLIGDILLTGDTLFQGSVGRSDFHGGNSAELIKSIKEKLAVLPQSTKVYPGHGPASTIGYESMNNMYLMGGMPIW